MEPGATDDLQAPQTTWQPGAPDRNRRSARYRRSVPAASDPDPEAAEAAIRPASPGEVGGLPLSQSASEASGSEYDPVTHRRIRRMSVQEDRDQFTANRDEAVHDAIFQVRGVYLSTMLLGFIIICIATYFEVKSLYVLVITYDLKCDQPLWRWLCGHIVFGMLREFCVTPLKNLFLMGHVVWTFYGFFWFSAATTCRATNPELFNWVEVVLIVAAVFLAASTLLPLVLYVTLMILIMLVNRGVLGNTKAAREGTLDRLHIVTFDPQIFAPADDADDPRPSCECCCCTENFDAEIAIVKTPCNHYYHKECLGDWLKLARTCPLCRCDLEEAVWNDMPDSYVADSPGLLDQP